MKKTEILSGAAFFLILTAILITVIDICAFRRSFYVDEYTKNNTAEYIRMSEEDLMASTDALLDYLRGKRDDIVVNATVNGVEREVFDERETLHMVDVRNLYQNAMTARTVMFIAGAALLAWLIAKHREMPYHIVSTGFRTGMQILAFVVSAILIYALADFNQFWMQFHYLFFDNDLFLLDPRVSIMINMFPETFFSDLVMQIILVFFAILAVLAVLIFGIWKRKLVTA